MNRYRMSRYGRDICLVLALKGALLCLLWVLFFGPAHTVVVTPARVDATLFAPPASQPPVKPRS